MIMLGLAGHAGSGKDSVAEYLDERYGFVKFSFSDAIYREVTAAFGLEDDSMLRDREQKELGSYLLCLRECSDQAFVKLVSAIGVYADSPISPRQILQWWGSEYRRAQDPEYWVRQARSWIWRIQELAPYPEHRRQLFVNTSVRFPNERAFIYEFTNSNIWHLHRDAAAPVSSHVSETPLPVLKGEREIFNNHTLDYLYMGVDQLLSTSAQFVRMEPPLPMTEPE